MSIRSLIFMGIGEPASDYPTAAEIADAVWDELLSGHTDAGSAGEALSTAASGGGVGDTASGSVWTE